MRPNSPTALLADPAVGARIRGARTDAAMSQVELARRIGCDRRAVQMWEKGEHGISRTNLDQLTRVLDVTETYLAGRGKARTSQEVHMQRLEDKVDQLQAKVDELLAALHSAQERST